MKICVVTGTRAEYGLLFWTMKALCESVEFEISIIATGMHLSPEFGLTYKQIENDGFNIDYKVEMLLSSDTSVGISKSIGLGIIGFADAFHQIKPDLVLVLGDRFETFAATTAAMIARLPIAHCHGGEATEGLIDESIRHSITKMSQIHFTSTEEYKNRVIQLGEDPSKVFNVGALGIENINRIKLLTKSEFEKSIGFILGELNFLITFHPVTLENNSAENQFKQILTALAHFKNATFIFTKPNADNEGRSIISLIDDFVNNRPKKAVSFVSLGQLRYLSAISHCDIIVGNSSSGLIEVPTFKKPTINIGDRQRGRITGPTVLNCECSSIEIINAINEGLSKRFKEVCSQASNPYGTQNSSVKIIKILKSIDLKGILKKKFYNLN